MDPAVIRRGFHSRWPQRRGEEGEVFFFFPLSVGAGAPIWGSHSRVGEQYALVCGMTNQPINKNGGLAGRVGRCTFVVKPPGVFPERFVRAVGEGEQVHLYGEATRMYYGTLSLVCCMANVEPISIGSRGKEDIACPISKFAGC